MNILVPVTWLSEYIETSMTPEELAALGSLHGPSFERIETIEGEPVYDIEITTNRVDAMSIKGLARELAAIGRGKVTPKKLAQTRKIDFQLETDELSLPRVRVETTAVKKIACVVLDQVKNCDSPAWLQKRLHQIGQNSHGIIVDMSNYVTHELGHPCHTFDYDKIMALGGEIIVKQAAKGKKFVTLDESEHETYGGEVVFESKNGEIIDLPAIKGTANTAVDANTKRVLFWLENMDAPTVRQASMRHAIRTVAAVLNEKNVDPALIEEVLSLGVEILRKNADAKVASDVFVYQDESLKAPIKPIMLDLERVNEYLGVKITPERVREILQDLGFKICEQNKQKWLVTPPTFRAHDVTMEADLIEEVARLYGYHLLPSKLDFPTVLIEPQSQFDFQLENRLKHALVDNGLTEVYTYSMISREQAGKNADKWLKLTNPLTEDKEYLRQSLIPSLLAVYAEQNVDPERIAGVFELANVYFPGETRDSVDERLKLAWVVTLPYRETRALLEYLLRLSGVSAKIGQNGQIMVGKDVLGAIEAHGAKLAVELDMQLLVQARRPLVVRGNCDQKPQVLEDLTFVIPAGSSVGDVLEAITAASPLVSGVRLGAIYRDHYTFHLEYRRDGEALTSSELMPVRRQIVAQVAKMGAQLVGSLEEVEKD